MLAYEPGQNLHNILAIAQERLYCTGDETWAMSMAFALIQLSRPEESLLALDRAEVVCSADPNFHMMRGVAARQLKDQQGDEMAMRAYREAIRLSPTRDDAHYCLGNLLSDHDDVEEAEVHLGACVWIAVFFIIEVSDEWQVEPSFFPGITELVDGDRERAEGG